MTVEEQTAIRHLVGIICSNPATRLRMADGRTVYPVQPPMFESLPHRTKTCQAAVKVHDGGAPFNVSLCDLTVHQPRPRAANLQAA